MQENFDVRLHFYLASKQSCLGYQGIQVEFEKLNKTTEQIKSELASLKKSLESDDSPILLAESTQISCAIREIEFKEAI